MSARPGPWLRLTALAGAAGVATVVATGAWGLAHDVAAHTTVALLGATVLAAVLAHPDRPELLVASATSFVLFPVRLAALAGAPAWLHVTLGAAALAAASVAVASPSAADARPHGRVARLRELKKPRIRSLLITGAGGMIAGPKGPSAGLAVATWAGSRSPRRRQRVNHVLDPRHRHAHEAHGEPAGRLRPRAPERALEFGLALSALSYVVLTSFVNVLAAFWRWPGTCSTSSSIRAGSADDPAELVIAARGRRAARSWGTRRDRDLTLVALALF